MVLSSDPVYCFQFGLQVYVGVDLLCDTCPLVSYYLFYDAVIHTCFCQQTYCGMSCVMGKVVHLQLINYRFPDDIPESPVLQLVPLSVGEQEHCPFF